jgi:hypothetical protein
MTTAIDPVKNGLVKRGGHAGTTASQCGVTQCEQQDIVWSADCFRVLREISTISDSTTRGGHGLKKGGLLASTR